MRVDYLDHMGSDLTVVNAARVSFDNWHTEFDDRDEKGSDRRLIRYLAKNNHWTPFGHPQIMLRITVPIFIANQLKRHQVGACLNEVSRRYVQSDPVMDFPTEWRGQPAPGHTKQGSSDAVPMAIQAELDQAVATLGDQAVDSYNRLIAQGIAAEQARSILPMAMETSWIWTGSLAFYGRVCRQRFHAHAQSETRDVAQAISDIIGPLFPVSWPVLLVAG